ncbi:MAG: MATE family efflux transporter [Clostridia bacterium]|nr:MATE family efflux transporter [Clostridia bacterium]
MNNKDIFENLSVPRAVAKLAVPTVLSQLVVLIYNLADAFFVGHTNDPSQIAALTVSFPIFMCLTMVANLFGIGANSFMSRSLGEKKPENARRASTFGFYGAFIAVGVLILVLELFNKPILNLAGAVTESTFGYTKNYLFWTFTVGGIPTVGSMVLGHLIRAEGNTKQASIGVALGGILNIVLDWLFVDGFKMGIGGAGIATCIANFISFGYLLTVALILKNSVITLNPLKFKINKHIAGPVILVGIPAATVIILGTVSNILLTNFMSDYKDVAIAAQGTVQKIGSVGIQITVGLTQGIMPLLGYCYGAGNMKRFKSVNHLSFIILALYAGFCITMAELFAEPLLNVFTTEAQTVEKGIGFIRIWFLCVPGMCFTNLFGAIFQSMGRWFQSLVLSLVRQLVILIPLLMILKRIGGEMGLMCAQPIADTLTLITGIVMYIVIMKKTKEVSE